MSSIDLSNYTCSNEGLILPIINEYTWAEWVRALLYMITMLWFFMGVAIVADVFMCGIEKITSKTRIVKIPDPEKKDEVKTIEVKVWNDTVANLSLMAFGTSAPEILLSVIEITGNEFISSDLGPGTIVGSAAFNLLVITGVCIVSIPKGETRKIGNIPVYVTTTLFAMLAYIWLIVVLKGITPNVVDIYEAIATLLMFPVLILTSYAVDKGCNRRKTSSELEVGIKFDGMTREGSSTEIIHLAKELGRQKDMTEDEAVALATKKILVQQHHNRGWYRVHATRGLTGGHRLIPKVKKKFNDIYNHVTIQRLHEKIVETDEVALSVLDLSEGGAKAVVEFTAASCAVLENEGKVRVGIKRYGKLDVPVEVIAETIDGSAEAGSDYKQLKQVVKFSPNERLQEVYIEIIDDDVWEPDEMFYVKLTVEDSNKSLVVIGKTEITQITIINDDEPGKFEFSKPSYIVRDSVDTAQVFVKRVNGADGTVSVSWKTKDMTAVTGKDYNGGEGSLTFGHGETSKPIEIKLMDTDLEERDHSFQIELKSATGGADIGKINKCIVTLVNDVEFDGLVSRIANKTSKGLDGLRLDTSSWKDQFREAMNVNGGDLDNATALDYILHFVCFFWKALFALIPPPSIGGGWLTFSLALAVIGLMTAIIGDLASIFGCLVGLEKTITAITFVALGTSMPDTFASKAAAVNEKTADSSVGNINGSNAVNVFLGLGLPWVMAASYWLAKGQDFEVKSGSLVFSVILYTACSLAAVSVLMLRRSLSVFGGAELGGSTGLKYACGVFMCLLWVFYVVMSSLQTKNIISANI